MGFGVVLWDFFLILFCWFFFFKAVIETTFYVANCAIKMTIPAMQGSENLANEGLRKVLLNSGSKRLHIYK